MRLIVLLFISTAAALQAQGVSVERFAIHEQSFRATGRYANPYVESSAEATLTAPDGSTRVAPLFWDGGETWKLRFAPDRVGEWRWAVRSADPIA